MHHKVVGSFQSEADVRSLYYRRWSLFSEVRYSRSISEVNSNRVTSSLLRKWTRLPTHACEVGALTFEVTDNFGSNGVLPCGAYGPRSSQYLSVWLTGFAGRKCHYQTLCLLAFVKEASVASSQTLPPGKAMDHCCAFCPAHTHTLVTNTVLRYPSICSLSTVGGPDNPLLAQ